MVNSVQYILGPFLKGHDHEISKTSTHNKGLSHLDTVYDRSELDTHADICCDRPSLQVIEYTGKI